MCGALVKRCIDTRYMPCASPYEAIHNEMLEEANSHPIAEHGHPISSEIKRAEEHGGLQAFADYVMNDVCMIK